jgi:hypothetical protein
VERQSLGSESTCAASLSFNPPKTALPTAGAPLSASQNKQGKIYSKGHFIFILVVIKSFLFPINRPVLSCYGEISYLLRMPQFLVLYAYISL